MRPTSKLGHGLEVRAGGEAAQDIGEGTVPPFLQGLLGDDRPHAIGRGEQILIFRGAEVVLLRRLDRHLGRVETGRQQPVLHVVGVNMAAFPLVGPGAFDLNEHDRPDVAPGLGLQAAGFRPPVSG